MDRYRKKTLQNGQYNKLIRNIGLGLGVFVTVLFVVSQLIGNTNEEINVAQQAVDSLFYDAQQVFLAEDISNERLESAQREVGRLKWSSRGPLLQRVEMAKQKLQYLDMLSTLYDTSHPMIVGNVVSKVTTIKETVTQDLLTQTGQQLPKDRKDQFNQMVINLHAQAQETWNNIVDTTQVIDSLPDQIDGAKIAESVTIVQSIESRVLPLTQQPLLKDAYDRFQQFAKKVSNTLLEIGTENIDSTLLSQIWECQCLSTYLSGTPFDSRPVIALTFDDGPNPEVTPQVLEVLKKHQVKGTFFVVGASVDTYPELAKQIVDEGHQIANHTYTHPDLAKLSDGDVLEEIQQTQEAIFNATGATPELYRLPYGSGGARVVRLLKPLTSIIWNIDSEDWKSKDKELIVEQVLAHVQPQSLLLMHDTHQAAAPALDKLIPLLKEQGYRFVFPQEVDFDYHYY